MRDGIDGFTSLGNVLQNNMVNAANVINTVSTDLGTITADLSLITDSYPQTIPKGDYLIDVRLTANHGMSITGNGSHGGHDSGNGSHEHELNVPVLKANDRVLVAIVGKERIVMAVVTDSSNI